MNNIGTKIKRIREGRNYTQEYVSGRLKISQNTYSKIESGSIKLTTDRLKEISKILEVPVESLLNEDSQVFNFTNSHVEKFYGYIENLQEENKDLNKKLGEQITYLQQENERLLKVIEKLSGK
jgi:transcriptional regulator with XRE-family HTH domain